MLKIGQTYITVLWLLSETCIGVSLAHLVNSGCGLKLKHQFLCVKGGGRQEDAVFVESTQCSFTAAAKKKEKKKERQF